MSLLLTNLQTNFVPFKQANVPAMQARLFQFNDDLRNEIVGRVIQSRIHIMIQFLYCHLVNVVSGYVP
jgi:hypothetical protein